MATLSILPSKRRRDVQRYTFGFQDVLRPGEVIDLYELSISVFAGVDPAPEDLLVVNTLTATETTVSQDIQLGVAGVIYEFLVTVTSNLGYVYTLNARLAVLPDETESKPGSAAYFLSSKPYPIALYDEVETHSAVTSGSQEGKLLTTTFDDEVETAALPLEGILRDAFIVYNYIEEIETFAEFLEAALREAVVVYDFLDEVETTAEVREGVLRAAKITYSNFLDEIETSALPLSGILS